MGSRPGRYGQVNVYGDEVAMSEQNLWAGRASHQPPRLCRGGEGRGAASLGYLSGTALKKAPACTKSRPLVGAQLGAFGPCLGFAVGAACFPTAAPGPAAKQGPPRTAVRTACQGNGSPKEGDARLWLKTPRSSIPQQRREAGIAITTATIV